MDGEQAIVENVARDDDPSTAEEKDHADSKRRISKRIAFLRAEGNREWHRLGNAVIRGAGAGLCLKGGLNLLSWVLGLFSKSRRKHLLGSPLRTLLTQVMDTLRYTLFLGSMSGVYVAADEGIAISLGRKRTAKWRSFVAGLLAGPTLLLTGLKERHTSLGLYILLRGITLLIRCGNKPTAQPAIRRFLAPTRWKHGDTALMCLSLSQLGYSWILKPNTLPPAYVNFLNHHGGKQPYKYRALRELAGNNILGRPAQRLNTLKWTPHADFCDQKPCNILHPGRHCATSVFTFLPAAYLRAIPVYAPVYVIPAILVHRQNLFKKGARQIWEKVGLGILRSSAFLATYCTLAWGGACVGFAAKGQLEPTTLMLSCWTGGLATLIEKKSRRMELAIYCVSRAVEAWGLCLVEWGFVSPTLLPKRLDVILFSLALGSILHCYSDDHGQHRDVFRSKYLNVLDFILGNRGLETGTIQHVPSTQDLLVAQGLDPARIRRSVSQLAKNLSMEYDAMGSKRSSASNLVSQFQMDFEEEPSNQSGGSE